MLNFNMSKVVHCQNIASLFLVSVVVHTQFLLYGFLVPSKNYVNYLILAGSKGIQPYPHNYTLS